MAGAGYKLFTTGQVLTAAEVNTYLQEQTVMVFNDAASRTTALSGVLAEGMVSYLKSTKVVEIYNGTAWASLDDPNAIQNTIVDAKGDLISASGNDVPARLAVGNNGETLVADSSTSTGLKWAKAPNFIGCSVYPGSAQTLSSAVFTAITYDSENFDTNGFHSTTSNTSRITIPSGLGGYYRITGNTRWTTNGNGRRILALYKNGASLRETEIVPNAVGDPSATMDVILNLAVGDYIEFAAYQSSGGNLNINAFQSQQWLEVQYLGA